MNSDQTTNHAHCHTAKRAQSQTCHRKQSNEPAAEVTRREQLHNRLSHGVEGEVENAGEKQQRQRKAVII